jgi:hypothetical protein
MCEVRAKLQLNLVGRLLGRDYISVEKDSLIVSKKGTPVASDSIDQCKEFATFKNGIFGGILALNIGKKTIRYRFLKKRGAEKFLKVY